MWNSEKVERALLMWGKWRDSIIEQWSLGADNLAGLTIGQLREKTGAILRPMGFPACLLLEMCWICCVVSDYVIDDHTTYRKIVIPSWLPSRYRAYLSKVDYHVRSRVHAEPPQIWDERTIAFEARQMLGGPAPEKILDQMRLPNENAFWIFLPSDHELYEFLNRLKGRPKTRRGPGKPPVTSDRLAVKCAAMRHSGLTSTQIGEKVGLPSKRRDLTLQNESVRWLIKRGEELLTTMNRDTGGGKSG